MKAPLKTLVKSLAASLLEHPAGIFSSQYFCKDTLQHPTSFLPTAFLRIADKVMISTELDLFQSQLSPLQSENSGGFNPNPTMNNFYDRLKKYANSIFYGPTNQSGG